MSSRYTSDSEINSQNIFLDDYSKIINDLIKECDNFSAFYLLDNQTYSKTISNLNNIRSQYKDINNSLNLNNYKKELIYICRVCVNKRYTPVPNIVHKATIEQNDCFIAFGNSQEESRRKYMKLIQLTFPTKSYYEGAFNNWIDQSQFETHIVSPWG